MPWFRPLVAVLLAVVLPVLAAPAARAADRVPATALPGLSAQDPTRVLDLNDAGQIIGESGSTPVLWRRARVTALPGSFATSINRRGQVVLTDSRIGGGDYVQHPKIWHDGTTTGIAPEGAGIVAAGAINDRGWVPMTYSASPAGWHLERAAVWRDGRVQVLPVGDAGPHLSARVINHYGLVAGAHTPMMGGASFGFRCREGSCDRLPDAPGTSGSYSVSAVNGSGVIVGSRGLVPLRWQGDTVTVLPGGEGRVADNRRAVNERGDVAGWTKDAAGVRRATVWRGGQQVVIPVAGPAEALAVNDNGDVVGRSTASGADRAFLWRNGRVIDLGTLGGAYSTPVALNNTGTIIGLATTADGSYRAVRWQVGPAR
ncbi:hypothetical protein GCM10010492_53730 [Saccharothrix mutabilis subsp. mutabilis]|uniref:Bulb-type lectin domain-containing protein n=1 Tax=Saccharothrix mutabilis subsp. mutabilis TaxID=66855 RepID=A0ABN0UDU2_9PSEU